MEFVASTLHTTSEHGVSIITTAYAHNLAASSRLNLGHRRFKWTRPFRKKAMSGFYACAITFQSSLFQVIRVKLSGGPHCSQYRSLSQIYIGRSASTRPSMNTTDVPLGNECTYPFHVIVGIKLILRRQ